MAKYFDVQKAKQDGRTDEEISLVMRANGLQPLPQQQQPVEKKGFIRSVGDALVKPGEKYVRHVAEGIRMGIKGGSKEYRDLKKKLDSGNITEAEALKFADMNKPMFISQETQDKYSTPGGALKETARATAGGASYPLAFMGGPVVSGALSSAAMTASEEGTDAGQIAGSGVLGGGFGLLGKGVGAAYNKVTGKVAKEAAEEAVEQTGKEVIETAVKKNKLSNRGKQFLKQFEVPRKIAERERPWESAKVLADEYGIKPMDLDDLDDIARSVTGQDGVLTQQVRKAVSEVSDEVKVGDLLDSVSNSLDDAIDLTDADKTLIQSTLRKSVRPGKLPDTANALDVFDAIKKLEGKGHDITAKSTSMSPNGRYEEMGRAYLDAADYLKDQLYKMVNDEKIITTIKDKAVYDKLKTISPKLAEKYWNTTTAEGLRSLQKPFVDLSNLVKYTRSAENTAFTKASERAGGNVVTKALNPAIEPVSDVVQGGLKKVMRPVSDTVAGMADSVSGATSKMGFSGNRPMFNKVAKGVGKVSRIANPAVVSAMATGEEQPVPEASESPFASEATQASTGTQMGGMVTITNQKTGETKQVRIEELPQYGVGQQGGITEEQVLRAMERDLMTTGGKNQAKLESMLSAIMNVNESKQVKQKALSASAAVQLNKAQTALESINRLEEKLGGNKAGLQLWTKGNPLNQGGRQLTTDITNAIDILGFFRTGAAITPDQRKDYYSLFPTKLDSQETIDAKLASIKSEFEGYIAGLQDSTMPATFGTSEQSY